MTTNKYCLQSIDHCKPYRLGDYIYWHDSSWDKVSESVRNNVVARNIDPFREGWNMSEAKDDK